MQDATIHWRLIGSGVALAIRPARFDIESHSPGLGSELRTSFFASVASAPSLLIATLDCTLGEEYVSSTFFTVPRYSDRDA